MNCQYKDCNKKIDHGLYCSYECAIYDGAFSIKKGWNKKRTREIIARLNNELTEK